MLLLRVPTVSDTFVTAVVVAVTRNNSTWSTATPVADVFDVAMSNVHTPVAYEPFAVPSKSQPFDEGVTNGEPVVAFDAVPGMYGHVPATVPFAMEVPVVAAAPCVTESCPIVVLADVTDEAVDRRKSI